MTDRQTMYGGLTCAAWGYFFLFFDFNLGTVSVLPAFAGYLMLRAAARDLSAERRDLSLLRPLLALLAVWAFGDWLLSWVDRTWTVTSSSPISSWRQSSSISTSSS